MAGSVNKVILVGNLGRDPESRTFQNGGKVVNLRIATSESWKDRNTGERKEKTEWHSVAIFSEGRSEEHTSELQSLMRISYAVFCLKKKNTKRNNIHTDNQNIKQTNILSTHTTIKP